LYYVPQHVEYLIERHEKRNGRYISIREEWIVEVYLKEGGVRVPALDVGFPKHKGKSANADEHNDYLKKYFEVFFIVHLLFGLRDFMPLPCNVFTHSFSSSDVMKVDKILNELMYRLLRYFGKGCSEILRHPKRVKIFHIGELAS
jgi:hypothetical protein